MKAIAYGIPFFMLLPVVIWVVIQNAVIGGDANSSQMSQENWISLGLAAIGLFATGGLLARMILKGAKPKG